MRRQNSRRAILGIIGLVVVATIGALIQPVNAQSDGGTRRLTVGQTVTGTLSAENFAESYVFDASAGNSATLTATTTVAELSLALVLTGPDGAVVARDGDLSSATVAVLSNVALPLDGAYVVTVLRGTGADGDATGDFTLALAGNIVAPATATPNNSNVSPAVSGRFVFVNLEDGGVDMSLAWASAVDLNLEVRDPIGGAIYGDNLTGESGGVHGGDVNRDCTTATADNPTESVDWPQGSVPVGSYEILIYYNQPCSVGGPQNFTLTTDVNGDDTQTISGVLNPGQVYLARVTLDVNRTWALFNGGVNAGLDTSLDGEFVEAQLGQTYTGTITNQNPKDVYTLDLAQGDQLSVNVDATSGSLDTLLLLLDPNGQRLLDNDDRAAGITDSTIQTTINTAGIYTVVVSRYGQVIGGTEGAYTLSINTGQQVANGTPVATNGTPTTPIVTTDSNLPAGSVEVLLTWATDHDLQLLVRDPLGNSVYDDATQVSSGGILGAVGNQGCNRADGTPTSYVYWPATRTPPVGTYEVEVWFQSDCDDTSLNTFQLSIKVANQQIFTTTQNANVDNHFMVTFTVNADGTPNLTPGEAGFFDMKNVSGGIDLAAALAGEITPMDYGTVTTGELNQDRKYQVYSFEGRAGERIDILMLKTAGNLDTAVYLIGPNNTLFASNDDISAGTDTEARNTNSRITGFVLTQEGTYYIIATHYGLRYGGTQGPFSLNLTLRN
ncbi:MAG: pre-peptidase C-terminal domain-containing protein [Chloroflexi bacterium]|nr:pre-peptidase C-terminal domain-containing protein [Chloroflexota bacterium]